MEQAKREIGAIVLREPRRAFPGVELRERTKLGRGVMYRTLDALVGQGWLGVDSMILGERRMNGYFITERGKLLFADLLGHSSGDDDIHSGDNLCRQVLENPVRVERIDEYSLAVISEAGESVVIPNNEFGQWLADLRAGRWDREDCYRSRPAPPIGNVR